MLKPQQIESESSRIREALQDIGGAATTEDLSRHLLDGGFWTDDQLAKVTIQWAQKRVRDALKETDSAGLPHAIPSASKAKSGAAIWKQLDMCSFADVEGQVRLLNKQELSIREDKDLLIRYAVRRWNRVPSMEDVAIEEAA
jgi:hypothetical protein